MTDAVLARAENPQGTGHPRASTDAGGGGHHSRYLFEGRCSTGARGGLSAQDQCEIMLRAQRDTYGDGLDERYLNPTCGPGSRTITRRPFVLQLPVAFGLLFGLGLYARYREEGQPSSPTRPALASTGEARAAGSPRGSASALAGVLGEQPGRRGASRGALRGALRGGNMAPSPDRFEPTWESLANYTAPDWYRDGKFGIFIHWGLYAVPAFGNEWYPRNMYQQGSKEFAHHVATHGPQERFGYKDFIPQFTAEHYDPDHWAGLFRQAGARFVVPVAEHHDGFAMYDTALSEWSAAKMGPCRDLIGELAEAVRKQWLVFGVSSHRAEHWWFFDGGMQFPSDVQDPRYAGLGPAQRSTVPHEAFPPVRPHPQLVDKMPQLVWFDWWIETPVFEPRLRRFAAYYYNRGLEWGRGVAINYKHRAFPDGTAVYDVERGQRPTRVRSSTDGHLGEPQLLGYVQDQQYKTATSIGDLVDIVSKNGALLLNIGPPDGDRGGGGDLRDRALAGDERGDLRHAPWVVYGEAPRRWWAARSTTRRARSPADVRYTTKVTPCTPRFLAGRKGEALLRFARDAPAPLHPPRRQGGDARRARACATPTARPPRVRLPAAASTRMCSDRRERRAARGNVLRSVDGAKEPAVSSHGGSGV